MKFADDPEVLVALQQILGGWRPTAQQQQKRRAARNNPAFVAQDAAQVQLEKANKLVQAFQSRPVRKKKWEPLELPEQLFAVAEPTATFYWSDKRDPNDPEGDGRQGVWKLFRHGHDEGCGLRLYAPKPPRGDAGEPMLVKWPEAWAWLGDFIRVQGRSVTGSAFNDRHEHGEWGLFASPDANALLAKPYGPHRGRFFLWHGGHLTVTWRGIEG